MKIIIPMLLAGGESQQEAIDCYCPSLLTLLAVARQHPIARTPVMELFSSLGYPINVNNSADLPLAAASAYADQLPQASGWIYADMVNLSADQNGLYCQSRLFTDLTAEEKTALQKELNQFLAEDGLVLYEHAEGYLLAAPKPIDLLTHSLIAVQGQPVQVDEIKGTDAKYWRSLQAELGMLLNQSVVNQRRREQGLATIDMIWFWGSGQLGQKGKEQKENYSQWHLCSEAKIAQGLAQYYGAPNVKAKVLDQNMVYYSEVCQRAVLASSHMQWQQALIQLEKTIFYPVLQQLRQSKLKSVELFLDQGLVFLLNNWSVKKFWCRPKSVQQYYSTILE